MDMHYNHCHRATAHLQSNILYIIYICIYIHTYTSTPAWAFVACPRVNCTFTFTVTFIYMMWIKMNIQNVRAYYKIFLLNYITWKYDKHQQRFGFITPKRYESHAWSQGCALRYISMLQCCCRTEVRYYASYDVFSQTIGSRKPLTGRASSATSIHLSTDPFITRICPSLHFFVDLIFHTIFLMAQVFIVSFTIVDVTSKNVKMTNMQKDVQERQER